MAPIDAVPADDFHPGMPEQTRTRVRTILGPVWERIAATDLRGRQATPSNPNRHPLALIDERVGRFDLAEVRAHFPGELPSLLTLLSMANILERTQDFEVFPELVAAMVNPEGCRHHLLTLALANHLRTYTPYRVELPRARKQGVPIVDVLLNDSTNNVMEIETKSRIEFEGFGQEITFEAATSAIEHTWRKKVGGVYAQLGRTNPGALLVGGVALKGECLGIVERAAGEWLEIHGSGHPLVWGIVIGTYCSYLLGNGHRPEASGPAAHLEARGGLQLAMVENRSYEGHIRIVPTPFAPEPAQDRPTGRIDLGW